METTEDVWAFLSLHEITAHRFMQNALVIYKTCTLVCLFTKMFQLNFQLSLTSPKTDFLILFYYFDLATISTNSQKCLNMQILCGPRQC